MADVEPIRIPIRAEVDPSARAAIDGLGAAARRASEGTAAPSAARGQAPGASADRALERLATTAGSLDAALARLERSVDGFAKRLDALAPGGAPRLPAPGSAPGPGLGQPPRLRPRRRPRPWRRPFGQRQGWQAVQTGLGVLGMGVGIGAVGSELHRWIEETRGPALDALHTTLAMGGGVGAYDAVFGRHARRAPGSLVGRRDILPIAHRLTGLGFRGDPADVRSAAETLGEVGVHAVGNAAAGGVAGADAYRTMRSERIPDYLATLVQQGTADGRNSAELLQQFQTLGGYLRASQGQYRRTDDEMQRMLGLQLALNALPDDIGRGAQGVELMGRLSGSFHQGGPMRAYAMEAYRKATGKGAPGGPTELVDLMMWAQDPSNAPRILKAMVSDLGPERAAITLSQGGRDKLPVWLRLARESAAGRLDDAEAARHLDPAARDALRGTAQALQGTAGMDAADSRIAVQDMRSASETMLRAATMIEQALANFPFTMLAGMAAGGALPFMLSSRRGRTMLRRMGRKLSGDRGGRGLGKWAAIAGVGAGFAADDLLDDEEQSDSDRTWSIGGALAGAAAGFIRGGPLGALAGGLVGYDAAAIARELGVLPDLGGGFSGLWGGRGSSRSVAASRGLPERGVIPPTDPRFFAAAAKYRIAPGVLQAVAEHESGFGAKTRGAAGEVGIMQIMPATAVMDLGISAADVAPHSANIDAGAKFLRQRLNAYGEDYERALSYYNAGRDGESEIGRRYARARLADAAKFMHLTPDDGAPIGPDPAASGHAGSPLPARVEVHVSADEELRGRITGKSGDERVEVYIGQ